MIDSLK